jgi:hypothetical protein
MGRLLASGLTACLVGAAGCGGSVPKPESVKIDAVPQVVLKTARERLPGYNFTRAYRKVEDGRDVFELLGKDRQGKVREIEVTPSGEFVRVE